MECQIPEEVLVKCMEGKQAKPNVWFQAVVLAFFFFDWTKGIIGERRKRLKRYVVSFS